MLTYPKFEPLFPRSQWTVPAVLEHRATHMPDRPFLQWTDVGEALTFGQVNTIANQLAHGFANLGVVKGDRVVLYLPNCLEYVLSWFALSKLGAVEVTVGPDNRGAFLQHQIQVARARVILTTKVLVPRLVDLGSDIGTELRHVVVLDSDGEPSAFTEVPPLTMTSFHELYDAKVGNPGVAVKPEDAGAVLFTSGTTGPSKGVVLPHSQMYWFSEQISQLTRLGPEDVYMSSFPLFHANAQLQAVYPALRTGIRCVLYEKFSATDWLGRIRRSGATVTNLLGATMAFIAALPPTENERQHPLRCLFAVPSPALLMRQFKERFGIVDVVTGFGQTEVSNVLLAPPGIPRPDGACGVQLDQWFEYRITDPETLEEVAPGAVGELWIRHRVPGLISDSFFGMADKTIESRAHLWFHLGDAMRRDSEGWYFFVDRMKDTLRRRGENISSFEVEEVVRQHPGVTECAVVAVPAEYAGGEDEVKVCVVSAPGASQDPAQLVAFCKERMPAFAVPRYVEYLETLPKTASEKVQKVVLRNRGITPGTWDRLSNGNGNISDSKN